MEAELTIVIPAKNEVVMLPRLLESLCRQDYMGLAQTRVLVADAGSTDGTVEAALGFRGRLNVEVVAGGLPSVGRNAGARLATTKYVLVSGCGCGTAGADVVAACAVEDGATGAASGDDEYCLPRR